MRNSSSRYGPSSAIATLLLLSGNRGLAGERAPDAMADLLLKPQGRAGEMSDSIAEQLTNTDGRKLAASAPLIVQPQTATRVAPAADMPQPIPARRGDFLSSLLLGIEDGAGQSALSGGVPLGPTATNFKAAAFPSPDPASLLLLQVDLDGLSLTDGLAAYGATDDPFIPMGEFTRLLELDVDVSPADGRIVGRLGEARRSLVIDLATGVARVGPVDIALAPRDVAVTPAEIYIRRSAIERLLPLRLTVNPQALTMKVGALELLPLQGRLQRQARLAQASPDIAARQALRVVAPYKLFSPPSFDVALGVGAQTTKPQAPFRYDIRLGGDLAYMGLQAYVGSDESGRASSARVLLERRSLDGDLLGPLHAHSVGLGDVFTPGLAIGPRSLGGRGVAVSTVPLDQTYVFNRIDLRGALPLGDDVELYVNDVLRGTQNTASQGQYEFLNVALTQGLNVVRIVTYGPRGQRTEDTRVINVSGGLLKPGQATLEFGATQQDQPLFRVRSTDPLLTDRGVGKSRVVASVNYGLTQYLTLSTGVALYHTRLGDERRLLTGGLRTSISGFATQIDLADAGGGRQGASIGVAGRVLGANTVLRHAEYRGGLIDENNAEADLDRALRRRTEFTIDNTFAFGQRIIPVTFRALNDTYRDGGKMLTGSARGSSAWGSILYSQGLEYIHETQVSGATDDHLRGLFSASTYRNYQWQVRGNFDYDITPQLRARILNVTADRDISQNWALRFAVNQHLDQTSGTDLIAGSVTRTRFGDLAFTGEYDTSNQSFRLGLQMNFGLGYNPTAHAYEVTRSGPGSGGSIIFHAFIDTNGDGVYESGEPPVANVVLEGGERTTRTDAQGLAYMSGFGAVSTARLLVSLNELDNPDVKTPPTTVEFTPRPGGVTEIAYPMRPTAEVIISLKLRRGDQKMVGLSATRLRLLGDHGIVLEGVTEFDGTANLQNVPVGTYRVELEPEQATRLRMRLAAPLSVTVKTEGGPADVQGEVIFEPRDDTERGAPN